MQGARILCPDDHPNRYDDPSEAFASVNRTMRDEVLVDPEISTVYVMVGTAAAGKSTRAAVLAKTLGPDAVILDLCNSKLGPRRALVKRIRRAHKRAVAVRVYCPLEFCEDRDAVRPNERRVGKEKITEMFVELRRAPVSRSEGWHEIQEYRAYSERLEDPTVRPDGLAQWMEPTP